MDAPRYVVSAVSWAFVGISTCATVGRYAIRYHDDRRFKWDDVTHFIAFCFMFANVMVYQVTFDALYSDTLRAPFPVPSVIEPADQVHLFWLSIAQCMVGFLCLIFVKLSFLLYYHQIFKSSSTFTKWWWAVLAFALVTYGVDLAGCLTVCGPVQELGNFTPSGCLSQDQSHRSTTVWVYTAVANIVSDIAVMALPIFMIRNMQIQRAQKIGLAILFSVGTIIIIFDIIRVVSFLLLLKNPDYVTGVALWAGLECNVAVLVSCLPTYRTLLPNKRKRLNQRCQGCQSRSVPNGMSPAVVSYEKEGSQSSKASPGREIDQEHGLAEYGDFDEADIKALSIATTSPVSREHSH